MSDAGSKSFERLAIDGFARFPEQHNQGNLSLTCPKCKTMMVVGVTPNTDFVRMAEKWLPWNKCDCDLDNIELSFCGPGLFGFLPEMFRSKHDQS